MQHRRTSSLHRSLWLVALGALLGGVALTAGCDDGSETSLPPGTGGGQGGAAAAGGQGGEGGACESGIRCGVQQECCDVGEECVNGMQCLPTCAGERCGANLTDCCPAGQICLDGVWCAADCGADETLCGADLDSCCAAGDVCLSESCVTPGASCDNNFDCLQDGWYCEETIGQCLPLPPGPLCEGDPDFNPIEPDLEWYWPGIDYNGLFYQNILVSPAVGDVDGDGTSDVVIVAYAGAGGANTLLVALSGAGDGNGNGEVLFTIPSASEPGAPAPFWLGAVALGNFDADPGLEIAYNMTGGGVRIADNDGNGDLGVRTSGNAGTANWGGLSLSDLDHDGVPDVIIRCHALNGTDIGDPNLDFMDVPGCGQNTVVADLDQDGRPEVIDASHATTADPNVPGGETLWSGNGVGSGYLAVADLLPAVPGPEVINIYQGFYVVDGQSGAVLIGPGGSVYNAAVPIPGGGSGGAPTVADFDGDGLPEVSTAGLAAYVVYDPDCADPPLRTGGQCATGATNLVLWSTPTQDLSSSSTGSSVFDFQGDGPAEVLYNDECFLHVYDGSDGSELIDPIIPSSSRTAAEYPLVADVDGDGNAEIVVISNQDQAQDRDNCDTSWKNAGVSIDWLCQYTTCSAGGACNGGVGGTCDHLDGSSGGYWDAYQCDSQGTCQLAGGTHGVRIYGDSFDRWVKTRPVWNQFAYHVTNIEFQGGQWNVPASESPNWLSYNNYRQNVQGGALFPVPDLQVDLTATPICPTEIRLAATVSNEGSAGAPPGVEVMFYRTDAGANNPPELLGSMTTSSTILPGGWEQLVLVYPSPPTGVTMTFRATTDPNAAIEECDDENNFADSLEVECPEGPR